MRNIVKQINNGRRYDLDTAHEVVIVTHGIPGAYSFYVERLLRKRNGEYVLHGKGRPSSPYAQGERFVRMTPEEAREWGKKNMSPKAYQAEFGK